MRALLDSATYQVEGGRNFEEARACLAKAGSMLANASTQELFEYHQALGELHFKLSELPQADAAYRKAIELSFVLGDSTQIAAMHTNLANVQTRMGNYAESIALQNSAMRWVMAHDRGRYHGIKNNLAVLYRDIGKHSEALRAFAEALHYFESVKDYGKAAVVNANIGELYIEASKEPELALKHLCEAVRINKQINNTIELASNFHNMALAFLACKQLDSAGHYAQAAFELKEALNVGPGMAQAWYLKGMVATAREAYPEALQHFAKAGAIAEESSIVPGVCYSLMETGRVMIRQGRFESAIPYLHRAHLLSREIGHSALVVETGELYYTALKNADRSRDALEVSEYLYAYRDSLQRHGSELALAQARLEYETSLAEAEKSALRSETAMKAAELGAERRIRVALVVAMAILIALSIFLGWVNSKRKELHGREHNLRIKLNEQNKILRKQDKKLREANQLKDRIFAVLGHDLRAPLANISGLMSIANSGKVAADDFRVVLQQLSSETERSLKTLQNILQWSSIKLNQNPVNASEQVVSSLIAPVIEGFAQHCKAKGVKLINLIAHDATIYVDSNQFTSIATNLLSNAIKYSPLHSEVEIGLEEGNGYRTFYVADRGAGMDAETLEGLNSKAKFTSKPGTLGEKGTGVGLRIMLDFVEAHGGQLLFEAREGGGTRVLVRLPHPPAQVAEVALDQAIS